MLMQNKNQLLLYNFAIFNLNLQNSEKMVNFQNKPISSIFQSAVTVLICLFCKN